MTRTGATTLLLKDSVLRNFSSPNHGIYVLGTQEERATYLWFSFILIIGVAIFSFHQWNHGCRVTGCQINLLRSHIPLTLEAERNRRLAIFRKPIIEEHVSGNKDELLEGCHFGFHHCWERNDEVNCVASAYRNELCGIPISNAGSGEIDYSVDSFRSFKNRMMGYSPKIVWRNVPIVGKSQDDGMIRVVDPATSVFKANICSFRKVKSCICNLSGSFCAVRCLSSSPLSSIINGSLRNYLLHGPIKLRRVGEEGVAGQRCGVGTRFCSDTHLGQLLVVNSGRDDLDYQKADIYPNKPEFSGLYFSENLLGLLTLLSDALVGFQGHYAALYSGSPLRIKGRVIYGVGSCLFASLLIWQGFSLIIGD